MQDDGSVRILLITSRGTGRWVIPKGNPMRRLQPHQAAAREAFEEAGVAGVPHPLSIGSYRYDKHRPDGTVREATVDVFPLAVGDQFDAWPEQGQREVRWFTQASAVDAVVEPSLKALLAAFQAPPGAADSAGPAPDPPSPGRRDWSVLRWLRSSGRG